MSLRTIQKGCIEYHIHHLQVFSISFLLLVCTQSTYYLFLLYILGREAEKSSPKANISEKLQKLAKGLKSLPQMFYREEEDEVEEMQIGLPTDVQHVGHIGWDQSNSVSEFMSFSSLSLRKFELAVAARESNASV